MRPFRHMTHSFERDVVINGVRQGDVTSHTGRCVDVGDDCSDATGAAFEAVALKEVDSSEKKKNYYGDRMC